MLCCIITTKLSNYLLPTHNLPIIKYAADKTNKPPIRSGIKEIVGTSVVAPVLDINCSALAEIVSPVSFKTAKEWPALSKLNLKKLPDRLNCHKFTTVSYTHLPLPTKA